MVHLYVVIWPIGLKPQIWCKDMRAPIRKARLFRHLAMPGLGVDDLLQGSAII